MPCAPSITESFRLVRNASTTPLAMGELFHTKYECLPLFTEQLIDFIRCDLGHIGGITEAKKIAILAEPYSIQTAWHGPGDIGPANPLCQCPCGCLDPQLRCSRNGFLPGDRPRRSSPAHPNIKTAGSGPPKRRVLAVDINEEAAKKYPYQRNYLPVCRRADGSVHDW